MGPPRWAAPASLGVALAGVWANGGLGDALTFAGVLALLALGAQLFKQHARRAGEPPLFGGALPFMGHALTFAKDHGALLRRLHAASGGAAAFTAYIAGQRMTFIKSPLHYPAVLKERKRLSFQPVANQVMTDAFGSRMDWGSSAALEWIGQDPHQHAMLRGSGLKTMMAKTLPELLRAMAAREAIDINAAGAAGAAAAAAAGGAGGWVAADDLNDLVWGIVWQATSRSLYGDLLDAAGDDGASSAALAAFRAFDAQFPALLGGAPAAVLPGGVGAAMESLRQLFVRGAAAGTRAGSSVIQFRQDYLAEHVPPHEHGTFNLAFTWATMANTVPTAFWALFWTLRDPAAAAACKREVDAALGPWFERGGAYAGGEGPEEGVARLLGALPALDSVIAEALRLCIGSITVRRAACDFELELEGRAATAGSGGGGLAAAAAAQLATVRVREGDQVVLAPTLTHMDAEVYEDPRAFRWDRFLDPKQQQQQQQQNKKEVPSLSGSMQRPTRFKGGSPIAPDIALQPFGGGVSMCPGRHLAFAEVKAFVALVLYRWEVELMEPHTSAGGEGGEGGEGGGGAAAYRLGDGGVPQLEQQRAGLGSLPPATKTPCRWRVRPDTADAAAVAEAAAAAAQRAAPAAAQPQKKQQQQQPQKQQQKQQQQQQRKSEAAEAPATPSASGADGAEGGGGVDGAPSSKKKKKKKKKGKGGGDGGGDDDDLAFLDAAIAQKESVKKEKVVSGKRVADALALARANQEKEAALAKDRRVNAGWGDNSVAAAAQQTPQQKFDAAMEAVAELVRGVAAHVAVRPDDADDWQVWTRKLKGLDEQITQLLLRLDALAVTAEQRPRRKAAIAQLDDLHGQIEKAQ